MTFPGEEGFEEKGMVSQVIMSEDECTLEHCDYKKGTKYCLIENIRIDSATKISKFIT